MISKMSSTSKINYEITKFINKFGENLFKEVFIEDENLLISPFSIFMVFAMLYVGSEGETKDEIRRVFNLDDFSDEEIQSTCLDLLDGTDGLIGIYLEIANSIWKNKDIEFGSDFMDVLKNFFKAESFPLTTAEIINSWCSEKTHGKINNIVDVIDQLVAMVLINAVYFKAEWQKKFEKNNTKNRLFHSSSSISNEIPMMEQSGKFYYYEDDNVQAIKMNYGPKNDFDMEIILPNKGYGISNVFDIKCNYIEKEGTIIIPRFEFECKYLLNEFLKKMGLSKIFTCSGDFYKITQEDIYVEKVLHKTYVKMDEEGSEAAAVTAIFTKLRSVSLSFPFQMICDRPFVFKINYNMFRHSSNMFLGYFKG